MLVIASRSPRLLAVLALAGLLGCSYGMVTDKESGAPLEGATIRVNAINVSYPDGSGNLIGTLPGEQIVKTWANAMPGSNGMGGWWYLNGYASVNPGDLTRRVRIRST